MRTTRMLFAAGMLLMTLNLAVFKSPHIRLAIGLATGQIDGHPIPVHDFSPARFTGPTMTLRCGELLLDVPEDARVEPQEDRLLLWVRFAGAVCHVFAPMQESGIEEDLLREARWTSAYGTDELSQRLALYRSNGDQLSFWMNTCDAQSLIDRLEVRRVFCAYADRIEVLRAATLSGFLLFQNIEGTECMELDYFCVERPLRGRVFITLDPAQPATINQVRALVSSLRIDGPAHGEHLASADP